MGKNRWGGHARVGRPGRAPRELLGPVQVTALPVKGGRDVTASRGKGSNRKNRRRRGGGERDAMSEKSTALIAGGGLRPAKRRLSGEASKKNGLVRR